MASLREQTHRAAERWSQQMRHVPSWSSMKRFGKNKLLQSSYVWLFFVPVVAKSLSQVSDYFPVSIFGNEITLVLKLPFSWEVWFYASCWFAIASFLFSVYCPQIIRDYDRYDEFRGEGKGLSQILDALFRTEYDMPRYNDDQFGLRFLAEFKTTDMPLVNGAQIDREMVKDAAIPTERLPEAFWFIRKGADKLFPFARLVCFYSYILGFALVGILALQNIYAVLKLSVFSIVGA